MRGANLLFAVLLSARVASAQDLNPLPDMPAPAPDTGSIDDCARECAETHPTCVGVDLTVRSEAAYTCRATCLVTCDPKSAPPPAPAAEPPVPSTPEAPAPESDPPPATPTVDTAPSSVADTAPSSVADTDALCRVAYAASSWADLVLPEPPSLGEDTLAHGSSFRMIAGNLNINGVSVDNDIDDEAVEVGLDLDTRYFLAHEASQLGYSVEVLAGGTLTRAPMGDSSLITNTINLAVVPELRFYPVADAPFFIHLSADSHVTVSSIKAGENDGDTVIPGHVGAVIGIGAGRVLNIDPIVRLRRLESALESQSLLTGAIGEATGTDIIGTWYELRNEIGTYPMLAATMKHLDEAGMLRAAPDLRSVYQAQQVLADPFIIDRRRGWDVRIGAGVMQTFRGSDDLDEPDPTIAILGSGQYEYPVDTETQLSVRAKLLVEVGDTIEAQRPWTARLMGAFTRVFYTDTFDPTGSLTAAVETGMSGRRMVFDDPGAGVDLVGTLAYSRLLNRGSLATAAVELLARNDGIITVSLNVGITWGIATGFFTPYSSVSSADW